jgi:hypothetical protein
MFELLFSHGNCFANILTKNGSAYILGDLCTNLSGPNSTIVSCIVSDIKIYNAKSSLERSENKNIFFYIAGVIVVDS